MGGLGKSNSSVLPADNRWLSKEGPALVWENATHASGSATSALIKWSVAFSSQFMLGQQRVIEQQKLSPGFDPLLSWLMKVWGNVTLALGSATSALIKSAHEGLGKSKSSVVLVNSVGVFMH